MDELITESEAQAMRDAHRQRVEGLLSQLVISIWESVPEEFREQALQVARRGVDEALLEAFGETMHEKKPAKDCACCVRRFAMLDKRLREAVELWADDLRADGANGKYIDSAVSQSREHVEGFIQHMNGGN